MKKLLLVLALACGFTAVASAQCRDPWVSQAVSQVMARAARGQGDTGECYIGNYGGGQWSSYGDLVNKVQAHFYPEPVSNGGYRPPPATVVQQGASLATTVRPSSPRARVTSVAMERYCAARGASRPGFRRSFGISNRSLPWQGNRTRWDRRARGRRCPCIPSPLDACAEFCRRTRLGSSLPFCTINSAPLW